MSKYNKLELTEQQKQSIFREEDIDDFEYSIVDELDWEDDGKYQFGGIVFEHKGKTYLLNVSRSGSYFTDYEFDLDGDVYECEHVEVIKKEWKLIENANS